MQGNNRRTTSPRASSNYKQSCYTQTPSRASRGARQEDAALDSSSSSLRSLMKREGSQEALVSKQAFEDSLSTKSMSTWGTSTSELSGNRSRSRLDHAIEAYGHSSMPSVGRPCEQSVEEDTFHQSLPSVMYSPTRERWSRTMGGSTRSLMETRNASSFRSPDSARSNRRIGIPKQLSLRTLTPSTPQRSERGKGLYSPIGSPPLGRTRSDKTSISMLQQLALPQTRPSLSRSMSSRSTAGSDLKYVTNSKIPDPNGKMGTYSGTVGRLTGAPQGKGRMDFANGGHYEGEWVHGIWSGFGEHKAQADGDVYEGEFEDDCKHGTGTMTYADGRIFQGQYVVGAMSKGSMVYQDGATYRGPFRNGRRHGCGVYEFADGSKYEGEFRDDRISGEGKMIWRDGGRYVGEWLNGHPNGFGKEFCANGDLRHEGLWQNGQIVA